MNVSEAVASRRSIRAFLDKPVDRAVLTKVLDKARRAPSGGNVQPWHSVVLGGEPLKGLIAAVQEKMMQGASSPEYEVYPKDLTEPYRSYRFQCGEDMYASIGIPREDKPSRIKQVMANFTGFGAPVILFCHTPAYMGKPQWSDLGMWLQTIMLLLREAGLDSCAQEAWSAHGGTIKQHLGIPEDHVFFCGIAIGYADPAAPINTTYTQRAPLEENTRFEGF